MSDEKRIKDLENMLREVLNETSHIGEWNYHNVLPKCLWDEAWQLLDQNK